MHLRRHPPSKILPTEKKHNKGKRGPRSQRKGKASRGNRQIISARGDTAQLSTVVERWMPLFPSRTTKTLRYSGNFGLTSTTGVVATYVLRANDCFDPDFTGTGHQPMGFDQMMVFYNHFCVVSARLIATFKSATGTAGTASIRVDAASTPITVIDQIIEFGGLVQTELESIGGFGANKVLQMAISIPRMQGVSKSALTADPTLRGDAATSPTEITYFHLQLWNAAAVTCTANVSFIMEQVVVFMEPRDATES